MCQLVNTEGATNGQGETRSPVPQESLLPEMDGFRKQLGEAQPMKSSRPNLDIFSKDEKCVTVSL